MAELDAFALELNRLQGKGEPALYPAFIGLVGAAHGSTYKVDQLIRASDAGFPDLTVTKGVRKVNWIEIKDPAVAIDPLPNPDRQRFARYREQLPRVVLTNGHRWQLFENGAETRTVRVDSQWLTAGRALGPKDRDRLTDFLEAIGQLGPVLPLSFDEACEMLAAAARLLHDTVIDVGKTKGLPPALNGAREALTATLRTNPADTSTMALEDFADTIAQTCTFGYLLARVRSGGEITPVDAFSHLDAAIHPFLKTSLHALVEPEPALEAALGGVLDVVADAVNATASKFAGPTGPWERVPYAYEPFFARFKPEDRFRFGVFYTPKEITDFQVRQISKELRRRFNLTGLTDPAVRFLDPACGTGTYLLSLGEIAASEASAEGKPVAATLDAMFKDRVFGFEIFPGPAIVAQARLGAFLESHGVHLSRRLGIYIVNSLTPATGTIPATGDFWLDQIGVERGAGDRVKAEVPILVVFGNPPWGDRKREQFVVDEVGPGRVGKKAKTSGRARERTLISRGSKE